MRCHEGRLRRPSLFPEARRRVGDPTASEELRMQRPTSRAHARRLPVTATACISLLCFKHPAGFVRPHPYRIFDELPASDG
jgi:hypothetical protein